jgi:Fic family protein
MCKTFFRGDPVRNKKPPFEITNAMIDSVAEVAELMGKLTSTNRLGSNPTLRRTNRIRTIHGSLAIEQNTLSLEQVTAVLNGKQVLAPPKDIAEVKNAYEIYERLDELDPYSVDDLLTAHGVMTRGLVEESGVFRTRPVGVVDREGQILHFGTLPQYVPDLVMELLDWTKSSQVHMLIRSCVFHYELELIHPFADGNGRIGRLWHTLLLSKWNPAFAWLPVESIIHDRQAEYYAAINTSNDAGESTMFVEFMLSAIEASLIDAIKASDEMSDGKMDQATMRWKLIEEFLKNHDYIMNADVRELCGVSAATANRILNGLAAESRLVKCRPNGHWAYILGPVNKL